MNSNYYVQVIAQNYLKNIINAPAVFKIHESFLNGVEKEQFIKGFLDLHATIKNIYGDIIHDPASFNMLLKENKEDDAKNSDYTNSNASFIRIPNLLLVLGAKGELKPDISLSLNGAELCAAAKELKITNMPLLLAKLLDYGFEINGLGKTIKAGDIIDVSYPDNRYFVVALKAMADALMVLNDGILKKSREYFYMLHYGLLENEKVKAPKLNLDLLSKTLDAEKGRYAEQLGSIVAPYAKATIRMGGFMRNDWSCVYTGNKSKKVIMSISVVQDDFSAKLNLKNIGKYIDLVNRYPLHIQEAIRKSGWECGHCNGKCAGGFAFEMEGKAYNKCRGGSFVFNEINEDTIPYCKELLERELTFE